MHCSKRNIFPSVFIILFSEYFDFLPGFLFPCQHSKFNLFEKTESLENYFLSLEILVNETPQECQDESLNLPVWPLNVRVGRLSQYFMLVVTMFLGILENSSWGVMTTMASSLGLEPALSLARYQ